MAAYKAGASVTSKYYTPFYKTPLKRIPVLNQELQSHDPVGLYMPVLVMYGSTPHPRGMYQDGSAQKAGEFVGFRTLFSHLFVQGKNA